MWIFCYGLRLATRWVATLKMTRFFKISQKIQKIQANFKISKQIQNLPKFLKKTKQIPRKFPNTFQTKPKISTNPKKFPKLKQSPKKFHKNTKSPPPSPYFQPLKHLFVIFRNTFFKKFANFCHKSEKLYYNFIVIKNLFAKPCLFKRITASAHAFCAKLKASAERQKASHKSKVCLSY